MVASGSVITEIKSLLELRSGRRSPACFEKSQLPANDVILPKEPRGS